MGKPRLPWKRGPRAWEIVQRADSILEVLNSNRRGFYSLRRAAKLLGVSTQPVRDWIRLKHLKRDGPRQQISRAELQRFIKWLAQRAEAFENASKAERFCRHLKRPPYPFDKLGSARFVWPQGRASLSPRELANLIGCHPSLIVKAIKARWNLGHRRTPCRWAISKSKWSESFIFSLITKPRMPALPGGELVPTAVAADYLRDCGMSGLDQLGIRNLIKSGQLQGVHKTPRGLWWFIPRKSLKKFAKNLTKTP